MFNRFKTKKRHQQHGALIPHQLPAQAHAREEPVLAPGQLAITFTRTRMVIETSHQIVDVPGRVQALLQTDPVALQEWAERNILPAIDEWQARNVSSSLSFNAAEVR